MEVEDCRGPRAREGRERLDCVAVVPKCRKGTLYDGSKLDTDGEYYMRKASGWGTRIESVILVRECSYWTVSRF